MNVFILVAAAYGIMSLVTMIVYAIDKRAAIKNKRRIPEKTLHLLALLGGIPGTLIAQQLFKHKRRKFWYMTITILIAVMHTGAWIAYFVLVHNSE